MNGCITSAGTVSNTSATHYQYYHDYTPKSTWGSIHCLWKNAIFTHLDFMVVCNCSKIRLHQPRSPRINRCNRGSLSGPSRGTPSVGPLIENSPSVRWCSDVICFLLLQSSQSPWLWDKVIIYLTVSHTENLQRIKLLVHWYLLEITSISIWSMWHFRKYKVFFKQIT